MINSNVSILKFKKHLRVYNILFQLDIKAFISFNVLPHIFNLIVLERENEPFSFG